MSSEPIYNRDSSSPSAAFDGRKLILSVDDDSALLCSRHRLLSSAGYGVISANDGAQALQLFGSNPVDLVLLDYSLPIMDGCQVAEAMKEYEPAVPIIIVSGADVPDTSLARADRYVRKGENPEVLLTAIGDLVASSIRSRGDRPASGI